MKSSCGRNVANVDLVMRCWSYFERLMVRNPFRIGLRYFMGKKEQKLSEKFISNRIQWRP